jgi:predicted RNase H-like HicB family nuclease
MCALPLRYAIVIEKGPHNYSAYVPDLPGCVTTGKTIEEIQTNMREAIDMHLAGMRADGESIPEPITDCGYIEV